ncbi:MAG TPA: C25 family cysteine peptidase, partial [Bacteroidales bacterium]|nr:C25 family cysteine peptidase [Bacteroidales bacterium]
MKKSFYFFIIFLLSSFFANASEWVSITSTRSAPADVKLLSSDPYASKITFSVPGFDLIEVETELGAAKLLYLEDASNLLVAEAPDLLKLTATVVIPDMAGMDVRVVASDYTDYDNILIAPSKGNLTRDIDPSGIPFIFGDIYQQDEFFPGKLAELREPFIMRDYRGQTIVAYPFQYNPVTRKLRVYHNLEVEIYKVNDQGSNPLTREGRLEKVSADYAWMYERHFLNAPQNVMDYTPVSEDGNMLIISYGAFIPAMQPLVDWRVQTGTPVEIVDVATIGGSSQIKSFIANYYNTHGLTFVLLVGDAAQVPSSYASGDSDNNYAYIVGSDHYPDVFIGRFSAETIVQVETQVNRTITYEKNPDLGSDWYTRGIGIASDQGPGDDGEYDYQHIRNINTDLLDFTYTFCAELFDGSQGGNDQPGNPTPSMVATEVNTGATVIDYTGHGSDNAWSSSNFSSNDVNNLTNTGMWPFIWSVACVNGNFVNGSCFAEAWLRATDNGEPTGAVATLMSTINQSWNPPMCGQDEMVDVLVESYPSNINRTFGAASMHG